MLRVAFKKIVFICAVTCASGSINAGFISANPSIDLRVQAPISAKVFINSEHGETPPDMWKKVRSIPIISSWKGAREIEILRAIQVHGISSDEPLYLKVRTSPNPKKVMLSATGALTVAQERPLIFLRVRKGDGEGQYIQVKEISQMLALIAQKDRTGKAAGVKNANIDIDIRVVSSTDDPLPFGYKLDLDLLFEAERLAPASSAVD